MNVTVFVSDVNDNSPQFTLPGGYQFSVVEGVAGLILGVVKVNQQGFFLDCRAEGKTKERNYFIYESMLLTNAEAKKPSPFLRHFKNKKSC